MSVDLIYFDKIDLGENNKFTLDFSDEEFIQKIKFDKKIDYYIASLDYNLILNEDIKKDEKELIEKLSTKRRLSLEKGPAYQRDIDDIYWDNGFYYNFKENGHKYTFMPFPDTINTCSFKYEFYDTVDKKIKKCQIYLSFSHFEENGFEFKKLTEPFKDDIVSINLFDNYKKIKTSFAHSYKDINYFANLIYRDRNSIFLKDKKTGKWYGTPNNLFYEATHFATTKKLHLTFQTFLGIFLILLKEVMVM